MKYYYTNSSNEPVGPVERSELEKLASQNIINDQTAVIEEGSTTWFPYSQLNQNKTADHAAQAIASGVSHATAAIRQFSWGSFCFGILLSVLSVLTLPWTVLSSAARELADWGLRKGLPTAGSDLPVLTFLVVVLRNVALITAFVFGVILAIFALFGHGLFYTGYKWDAGLATAGFSGGLFATYFSQLAIALSFEFVSVLVRIANDIKRIAARP